MFSKDKDRFHPAKTEEETQIESEANAAIKESRRQIDRARTILEDEVRRLDLILEGKS
jgi:5-bromo-4-chloroindolyl phosphate hydrolysis protein